MRHHLLTLLLSLPLAAAAQATDPKAEIAADRSLWGDVRDVEGVYAGQPEGWTRIEDEAAGVALSFPCEPQRQAQTVENRTVVQYMCTVGDRGYIAQFEDKTLDNAWSKLAFLISAPASIAEKLRGSGMAVEVVPVQHMTYGEARGRQSRIEADELAMELRALIRPRGTVLLGVRDIPRGLPGDMPQFFDSLELR